MLGIVVLCFKIPYVDASAKWPRSCTAMLRASCGNFQMLFSTWIENGHLDGWITFRLSIDNTFQTWHLIIIALRQRDHWHQDLTKWKCISFVESLQQVNFGKTHQASGFCQRRFLIQVWGLMQDLMVYLPIDTNWYRSADHLSSLHFITPSYRLITWIYRFSFITISPDLHNHQDADGKPRSQRRPWHFVSPWTPERKWENKSWKMMITFGYGIWKGMMKNKNDEMNK